MDDSEVEKIVNDIQSREWKRSIASVVLLSLYLVTENKYILALLWVSLAVNFAIKLITELFRNGN